MGIRKYFEFNYNENIYQHLCDIALVRGIFVATNTSEKRLESNEVIIYFMKVEKE